MAAGAHQGIAAFGSLHTSIIFTAAVAAHMLGLGRALRDRAVGPVRAHQTATVYFGWHYVVDDLAGVVIALVGARPRTRPDRLRAADRVAADPLAARASSGGPPLLHPSTTSRPRARSRRPSRRRRAGATPHDPIGGMKRVPLQATGTASPDEAPAAPPGGGRGRSEARSERLRTWWALGGCVLLALLLRVPYLSTPLGRDEGGLAYIAQHWPGGDASLYGDYWVDRPPLLILLFKAAVLGGDGGVRVLGAVAAVALVIGVTLLARAVEGPRAGWIAGLLAALMSGSVSIGSIFTPGEVLAVVPSTFSLLCLVLAHRSRQARFVLAAGPLAVCAALIKQSFLDAGFAGVVFVAASAAVGSGCAAALAARLRGGRGDPTRRAARLARGRAAVDRRVRLHPVRFPAPALEHARRLGHPAARPVPEARGYPPGTRA